MSIKKPTSLRGLAGLANYLIVLVVIVFISLLCPNNAKFKYEFERGQTWRHEDLVAPFDFAILKPDEEVRKEIEALEAGISPHYELQPQISTDARQQLRQAFQKQLDAVKEGNQFVDVSRRPEAYLKWAEGFVERKYSRGIVQLAQSHQKKEKDFVINIHKGNTTSPHTLQSLLTKPKLDERMPDSLFKSGLREAEFLIPLLKDAFQPNVFYNDTLTQKFKNDLIATVAGTRGMIRKGELIIPNGGIITPEIYQNLLSFEAQYERQVSTSKSYFGIFGGYFLLTSLIIGVFILYLQFNEKRIFLSFNKLIFMLLWLVVYSYLVYTVESNHILSAYLIPFCIAPIVIKVFYNERLALFTHIAIVLIASFLSSLGYEFTFLQILAGIVAVLTYIELRNMSHFFHSILYIFLAYGIGYLGLSLIRDGSLLNIDWSVYPWFFLNVFLTLLAYPMIPLLERLFGFISPITLVELSDMNRPLLKDLSLKAPGTLQHSLQVANLSEAAASQIKEADPLLVKVAALYHDIGKMKNPQYFIENQSGNNPHVDINNLESAKIIIEHVAEGVRLARKAKLPEVLIQFIKSHHGSTRVEYFYRNYLHTHPSEEIKEQDFRYPGPRPRSKEESILMMADSIEAAAKSLSNPTEKDVAELVDKIIAGKLAHEQLVHSELSFEELEICKQVFKKLLRSIYHVRIEYPEESS